MEIIPLLFNRPRIVRCSGTVIENYEKAEYVSVKVKIKKSLERTVWKIHVKRNDWVPQTNVG